MAGVAGVTGVAWGVAVGRTMDGPLLAPDLLPDLFFPMAAWRRIESEDEVEARLGASGFRRVNEREKKSTRCRNFFLMCVLFMPLASHS